MAQHSIEDKEIRGITVKIMRVAIVGYTGLILFGSGALYSLKTQIHDNQIDNTHKNELQDVNIKTLNQRLDQMSVDVKLQNTTITRMDIELERIKEKLNIQ